MSSKSQSRSTPAAAYCSALAAPDRAPSTSNSARAEDLAKRPSAKDLFYAGLEAKDMYSAPGTVAKLLKTGKFTAEKASKLGKAGSVLGGIGSGMEVADGVGEWRKGDHEQGGLDVGAGVIGLASAGAELAGATFAGPLGLAATAAELDATGNAVGKEQGYFGKGTDGENRTAYGLAGSIAGKDASAMSGLAGGGALGGALGLSAEVGDAAMGYTDATIANIAMGGVDAGVKIAEGAEAIGGAAMSGIGDVWNWAFGGLGGTKA